MNYKEAKLIALKAFASHTDIILDSMNIDQSIYSEKDLDSINRAFEEVEALLIGKAKTLEYQLRKTNKKRLN